jgi:hypothetical protein
VLLLVYAQVYFATFGFLDDFALLERSLQDGFIWWPPDTGLGRPIHALIVGIVFGPIDYVEGLKYVRILTVIGICLCAIAAYLWMSRKRLPRAAAASVAVAIFVAPTFQIYSGWATTFAFPFALLAASVAGLVASRALPGPTLRLNILRAAVGLALALTAMLTYQPAGMAVVVVVIADLLFDLPDVRVVVRRLVVPTFVFIIAGITSFVILRSGQQAGPETRGDLATDVGAKLDWFVSEALVNAVDVWDVRGSATTTRIVLVVILGGLLAQATLIGWRRAATLLLVPVGALVAYLPNLLSHEYWAAYRSFLVLGPFVAIVGVVALRGYWRLARVYLAPRGAAPVARSVVLATLLGMSLGLAVRAQSQIAALVVAPQVADYRAVSQVVPRLASEGPVAVVLPEWFEGSVSEVVYDEFGIHSSSVIWALRPMVENVLRAQGLDSSAIVAIDLCSNLEIESPAVRVVDLRSLIAPGRYDSRRCG